MSSEEYRTESFDTYRSSDEGLQRSESDRYTDIYPASDVEREIEDEHYDDFKTYVEMLVEVGKTELKPLNLTDCYTTDRPGMYLEILPKVIFETVETETGIEEVDFPKPIFRLTIDQGTIASVEHASSSAQTLRSKLVNSWSQYEPRLCSEEDYAATVNSESFKPFLKTAERGVFESLIQNRTADSFFWELKSLHGEDSNIETSKESSLIMKGSFVCFNGDHKQIINFIDWHPVVKDIFIATTIRNKSFEERTSDSITIEHSSNSFYVWSCKNQFMPKIFLDYFDEISLHKFNPTMPHVVVGGSSSGQLILWNLNEEIISETSEDKNMSHFEGMNSEPTVLHYAAISNPDHNHTRGITDCAWIPSHFEVTSRGNIKLNPSNESYQIATCGSDGIVKFWDLRSGSQSKSGFSVLKLFRQLDGKWEPFHTVELQLEDEKKSFSITKFTFRELLTTLKLGRKLSEASKEKAQISTEFYAGCDDGQIFCGNFKLFRDDNGLFKTYPPVFFRSPHSGPITTIASSPFICDIFLSTGARTVCIWNHDLKAAPIYCRDMHANITSAAWSNTRPALFILGYEDGSIEMWDLLENIYEPFLIHVVSTTSITAISVQTLAEDEHVVAVGDFQGIVYVLSLPYDLWMPADNEPVLMEEFVKKEVKRMQSSSLKVPDSTQKTTKVVKEEKEKKIHVIDEAITDEALQKNYDEFLELEQLYLRNMGLTKARTGSQLSEREETNES